MKGSHFNPCTILSCKNNLHAPLESYWAGLEVEFLKRNCLHGPESQQLCFRSYWGRNLKWMLLKGHHTLISGNGSRFKYRHKVFAPHDWGAHGLFAHISGFVWPISSQVMHLQLTAWVQTFKRWQHPLSPRKKIMCGNYFHAFWETCGESWTCLWFIQAAWTSRLGSATYLRYTWCSGSPETGIDFKLCRGGEWIQSLVTPPEVIINMFCFSCHVLPYLPAWWSSEFPEVK